MDSGPANSVASLLSLLLVKIITEKNKKNTLLLYFMHEKPHTGTNYNLATLDTLYKHRVIRGAGLLPLVNHRLALTGHMDTPRVVGLFRRARPSEAVAGLDLAEQSKCRGGTGCCAEWLAEAQQHSAQVEKESIGAVESTEGLRVHVTGPQLCSTYTGWHKKTDYLFY